MTNQQHFEVLIIGGSYAGLSAAMALGRSLRQVLIIDSQLPCNRQTPHSHNFLTHDGAVPGDIHQQALAQVLAYPTVQWQQGLAVSGAKTEEGFTITTETGATFQAPKLIFATGIKDLMPDIPGFAECWGISVIHCPYCHGYEFRNQPTGIIANGERAFHLASLVNNLTEELTVLTNGQANFTEEQVIKLYEHGITIVGTPIAEVIHSKGQLTQLVLANGERLPFQAVYADIPFVQHSDIPVSLGCALTEPGYLKVDDFQKTSVPGIFACGDNASLMRSIANAVATGNIAGAMANMELTFERF